MKRLIISLSVLFLAACGSHSLQDLRRAEPKGTPFQQALAHEYLAYADEEERNYNWSNSWHYADKGLTAAYGNDVGPEDPTLRSLTGEQMAELETARDALLTALPPPVVAAKPELAARAYIQFDCWVERTDDGWAPEKIATCREAFRDSLAELSKAKTTKSADGVDTTSYLVFFDWNRASINKAGKAVIADVAESLASEESYEVILNGHTDTTGLERFNLKLSKKRAESVANELVARGIDRKRIKIFAFGESDPLVATADNVDEPKNRRVEIFVE